MRVMLFGRPQLALAGALVALGLGACAAPPSEIKPVQVTSFQAAPNPVAAGGDVTLTWQVSGDVDHLQLLKGADTLATPSETSGSFVVEKLAAGTATFSLVVTGKGGDEARQMAEVTAVTRPTIGKFAADKTQVAAGTGVVLSWATALADTIEITANGQSLGQKTGADALQGALLVKPDATTEYTLTATGVGGSDKAKVAITVLPAPAFSTLEVTPQKVKAGETATLHWVTSGASSLTVKIGGRAVYAAEADKVGEGSKAFTPDAPTTFQVALGGPGGETTKDVAVQVVQVARVVSFRAEPPDALLGSPVGLSWEAAGVDAVQLTANGEPVDLQGHGSPTDSVVLQPQVTTLYELTGAGEGGQASASLLVNVYGEPLIDEFVSDRALVYRRRDPATLSWVTHNGAQISLSDGDGTVIDPGNLPAAAGSFQVWPTDPTDYVLTLVGPGGVRQSSPLHVEVSEPPPGVTLTAAKTTILEGEETVLTWEITDGTSFTVDAGGSALDVTGKLVNDLLTIRPQDTTVYTLTAQGPGGQTSQHVTVTVVKPPKFTVFTTDRTDQSGQTVVTRGTPYTLRWETTDATGVAFDPPTALVADTTAYVSIEGQAGTNSVQMVDPYAYDDADYGVANISFPGGFSFPFQGSAYGSVQMAVDGYLCFGGTTYCTSDSTSGPSNMPSTSKPNNFIAAFWGDLKTQTSSKFLWRMDGAAPNRVVTVEWAHHDFYSPSKTGSELNFQVLLFENGAWEIRNAPRPTPTKNLGDNSRWGTAATIGMEGPTGTAADTVLGSYDTTSLLCSSYVAGSGTTLGSCTPLTRVAAQQLPAAGSAQRSASATGYLKMNAYGPRGVTPSPSLLLTVVEPPVANTLAAARAFLGAGDGTTLSWAVGPTSPAGTVKRVVVSDGSQPLLDQTNPTTLSGTLNITPQADTTYTLEAYNAAGDKSTKTLDVKVGLPTASLTATGNKTSVPKGDQVELNWTTAGAGTVVLKRPDGTAEAGPFTLAADPAKVTANTLKITPAASGTYTLEATNGSGTTSAQVQLTVITDLQIVTFASSATEQTAKRTVNLSWEVYNGTQVTLTSSASQTPVFTSTDLTKVRTFSTPAAVDTQDTTFTLTVSAADGTTLSRTLTVTSVPEPSVTAFLANPASVNWGEQTTLSWTTTGAAHLWLYELSGTTLGSEVTAARDQLNGSVQLTLLKPTGYRLVVENRLGATSQVTKDLDPAVQVNVTTPGIQLTVSPSGGVPRGGYATVGWTATQAERVYLFGNVADPVYTPNNFVDVSITGTEQTLKSSGTGSANWDTGYLQVALPAGFNPTFFGESISSIGITADGVIGLGGGMYCGASASCSGISTLPSSTYKGVISVFSRDLSACPGSGTTCSTTYRSGGVPGKIFTQLMGTAPNRYYVVQWNNWAFYSTTTLGTLTFEAKIFENGEVELQYKTLQSPSSTAFTTTGGVGIQNAAASLAWNVTSRPLKEGDGWHFDTNAPQLPYDYVPYGFTDLSQSATATTAALTTTGQPGGTANYDTGYAEVVFPNGFAPQYLGEAMTRVAISADGALSLSSAASSPSYSCTAGCSMGALPSSTYKAVVAAFNADLSACAGTTTASACTARGRAPGRVQWELRGAAPNRVFIAQWTDWDFKAAASAGSLTFQAKIYENGDTEVQYKNLQSASAAAAQGSAVTVGLQNTAATSGFTLSSGTGALWRPLSGGDGFRYYSGAQAATGSVRTFFAPLVSRVAFRGTAINALAPNGVSDSKTVALLPGQNDLLLSELMIDPADGSDDGKEWIELRNTSVMPAPLAGYTIETSSGSYTFTSGQIPGKSASGDGLLVVGMSADPAVNGGVPVTVAYGSAVQMNDIADSVILRFGNILIDRVDYDLSGGWSIARTTSLALDPLVTSGAGNDLPSAWCAGRLPSDPASRASPGLPNVTCRYMPYSASYNIAADPTATVVVGTASGNDRTGTLTLGFPFVLAGVTYTSMTVCDNGWASLGATATGSNWVNQPLPNAGYGGVDGLYPYWDDLYPLAGRGKIYTKSFGTAPDRYQVVMWDGYSTSSSGTNDITMMVVLRERGGVEFYYASMGATGDSATVGYEYANDSQALQLGYNQAIFPFPGLPAQFGLRMR